MKILIISPTPTHQPIAGNRARILAIITSLTNSGHEVHFAWAPMEEGDRAAMKEMFGDQFHLLSYQKTPAVRSLFARFIRKWRRMMRNPQAYIWKIDDWYDCGLSEQILALHAYHSFEAVIVEYAYMSRALEVFPNSVLKIIDTHDRLTDRHLLFLQAAKEPEWFSTSSAEERKGLNRAHVVVAIQESEAREFNNLLDGTTQVITLGHLLDLSKTITLTSAAKAVFVGSDNSINVDAAKWLVNEVLPLLLKQVPNFELVFAGKVCNHICDKVGLCKLGQVVNVSDAYEQGCVAVNPLQMGTGLSIKTMDCLALGVPLVSTESGSRGLETLRGRAFLSVADNDALAMATNILLVWKDEALRVRLAKEASNAAHEWNLLQLTNLTLIFAGSQLRN